MDIFWNIFLRVGGCIIGIISIIIFIKLTKEK